MTTAADLPQRLGDLLGRLTPATVGTVLPDLLALYDDGVRFRDPIQELSGKRAFAHMNRSLAERSRDFRFEVLDRSGSGDAIFLRWRMAMRPKLGPEMAVEGASFLRTNEAGLVAEHLDYWDLPTFFASALPGGERLLRLLLKAIA